MVILLAEDDAAVQKFAGKALTMDGFTVLTAGDGKAALEAARKTPGTIDLLLSDVEMPRMDGLELSRNISTERPGIKVLLMLRIPAMPITNSKLMAITIPKDADRRRSEATLGCSYHAEVIGIRQSLCA